MSSVPTTVDRLRYVAGRSLLTLDAVPGMRLRVEKGQVWITQSGRPDDHVLGPGEWLLPQQRGLMLVYAFEPAMVAVSMPAEAADAAGSGLRAALVQRWHRVSAAVANWARDVAQATAGLVRH